MQNKKISIVVPVYNGEKFLVNCITSIINNNYKNIELILINDGSKDKSFEICKEFAQKDKRIKVFNQENSGIAKTRNFGLKIATGDYICFADQDDIVPENAYSSLINNLNLNKSDICIGSISQLINEKEKTYRKYSNLNVIGLDKINEYLLKISVRCLDNNYCEITQNYTWTIWNCIYKKSIIDEYNIEFKKFVNYEDDFLFNFDYIKRCEKISFEENVVYYWRKNIESESNSIKYIKDLYKKKQNLNEYILETLKEINGFNVIKWKDLSNRRFYLEEIVNIANPQNLETDKRNIDYLTMIYNDDIREIEYKLNYKRSLKSIIKNIDIYIAYIFMKRDKYIKAYNCEKIFFYKILLKIKVSLKKWLYKGV